MVAVYLVGRIVFLFYKKRLTLRYFLFLSGILFVMALLVAAEIIPNVYDPYRSLETSEQDLERLGKSVEMWRLDHHNAYPDNLSRLVPKYVDEIPDCALSKQPFIYQITKRDKAGRATDFLIICPGPGEPDAPGDPIPPDYPRYSGSHGLLLTP